MMTQAVRVDSESGVSQAPSPGHGFFFRKGGGGRCYSASDVGAVLEVL